MKIKKSKIISVCHAKINAYRRLALAEINVARRGERYDAASDARHRIVPRNESARRISRMLAPTAWRRNFAAVSCAACSIGHQSVARNMSISSKLVSRFNGVLRHRRRARGLCVAS